MGLHSVWTTSESLLGSIPDSAGHFGSRRDVFCLVSQDHFWLAFTMKQKIFCGSQMWCVWPRFQQNWPVFEKIWDGSPKQSPFWKNGDPWKNLSGNGMYLKPAFRSGFPQLGPPDLLMLCQLQKRTEKERSFWLRSLMHNIKERWNKNILHLSQIMWDRKHINENLFPLFNKQTKKWRTIAFLWRQSDWRVLFRFAVLFVRFGFCCFWSD